MAQIIQKRNQLVNEYNSKKRGAIIGLVVGGVCFVLMALMVMGGRVMPAALFFFGAVIGGGCGILLGNKAEVLRNGLAGEASMARVIQHLPDSYVGYQNVAVEHDGRRGEIDMLVVGPNGVFVVEAKHWNGTLTGTYDGQEWTQHKVGRGGTPYSSTHRSPVKQVGRQVHLLANHLRQNGVDVWINGVVYLANPETDVMLSGTPGAVPVFAASQMGAEQLCHYITTYRPRKPLSPQEWRRLHEVLSR